MCNWTKLHFQEICGPHSTTGKARGIYSNKQSIATRFNTALGTWHLEQPLTMICLCLTSTSSHYDLHMSIHPHGHQASWNVTMKSFRPHHLLWALHFMSNHSTERVMSVTLGTDRETLRKWVWPIIVNIATIVSLDGSWLCPNWTHDVKSNVSKEVTVEAELRSHSARRTDDEKRHLQRTDQINRASNKLAAQL